MNRGDDCQRLARTLGIIFALSASALAGVAQTPASVPCGVVSWWPLDGTGADVRGSNHGVADGSGGTFPAALVANGWKSGGQRSVIVVPDAPTLDVTSFTIEMWVRMDAINQYNMPLVWKGGVGGGTLTTSYSVAIRGTAGSGAGSPGMVFVTITDGVTAQSVQSTSVLPVGIFKHLTVTADGANINIYVDGVRDPGSPTRQTVKPINSSHPLQIGGVKDAQVNNFFNGVIDELTLYDRALDLTPRSEIEAIVAARNSGKCRS
jgi:hypothetical protein